MRRISIVFMLSLAMAGVLPARTIGVNVLFRSAPTAGALSDLGKYGTVLNVYSELNAATLRADSSALPAIQARPRYRRRAARRTCSSGSPVLRGVPGWDADPARSPRCLCAPCRSSSLGHGDDPIVCHGCRILRRWRCRAAWPRRRSSNSSSTREADSILVDMPTQLPDTALIKENNVAVLDPERAVWPQPSAWR